MIVNLCNVMYRKLTRIRPFTAGRTEEKNKSSHHGIIKMYEFYEEESSKASFKKTKNEKFKITKSVDTLSLKNLKTNLKKCRHFWKLTDSFKTHKLELHQSKRGKQMVLTILQTSGRGCYVLQRVVYGRPQSKLL